MRKHKNQELAHLKWRLINQEGLTPKEAEERINEVKKWDKKIKLDKMKGGNKK